MNYSSSSRLAFLLLLASSLFVHRSLGELICEELPTDICAYAIASSGKRCLLENSMKRGGRTEYQCRTSEVMVRGMSGYIETDQCVKACGVDRKTVGISSDALLEPHFTAKLCSNACSRNCPNILDLYFNLAAGEGVFLPDLCEKRRTNPRRAMAELMSSGAAPGPLSPFAGPPMSDIGADAPAPLLLDFGGVDAPMADVGADAPVPAPSFFDDAAHAPASAPVFM